MNKSDKEDFEILVRIFFGLILIGISNKLGNSNPPFSITATPILIPIVCLVINYGLIKRSFKLYTIVGYVILLLNDLFMRFYSGGVHDSEGSGFITLSSFIAFIILTVGFSVIYSAKVKHKKRTDN